MSGQAGGRAGESSGQGGWRRTLKDWGLSIGVGVGVFYLTQLGTQPVTSGAAPDFALADVAGGTLSLSAHRGSPVVINFWGSWCPPCRAEIPEFAAWHKENPDVPLIGIAVRSGQASTVAQKAKSLGINYPVAVADDQVVDAYRVSVFPTTIVVDAEGNISGAVSGAIGRKELDRLVAEAR